MTARVLDGKVIAAGVRAEVAAAVGEFQREHGRAPGLELVVLSDDPSSQAHVRNKHKAAVLLGMAARVHALGVATKERELIAVIDALNADPNVDGILVQLPLPAHLCASVVLERVAPAKDVDGLHPENAGALMLGRPHLAAPTARGCMRLLSATGVDLVGRRALVIGRSSIAGRPVAALLLCADATVTVAHSRSVALPELCREAEVLIVAAGRPRLVRGDWVKPGAVVIDVGLSHDAHDKPVGDVAFDEVVAVASWISPVPGGVGPLTIACLLENTVQAARARTTDGASGARGAPLAASAAAPAQRSDTPPGTKA
jgi:methylenetetrahydrofolate dehydrogenase (NADP+)/methenyltetrahydrofolate cyclohydrolase